MAQPDSRVDGAEGRLDPVEEAVRHHGALVDGACAAFFTDVAIGT